MNTLRRIFPPPLLSVMRRPTSVGLLLLAVAVAVIFSLLGQWQISRAVNNGDVAERPTEIVRALDEVAQPRTPTASDAVGQLVSVTGEWVAGDFAVLRDRVDNGRDGYWAVGHLRTDEGNSLAVALGWTADRNEALDAAERWNEDPSALPTDLSGRFQHAEAPTAPDGDDPLGTEMSPAAFVNLWQEPGPAYPGYITLRTAPEPLEAIWSPAPEAEVTLNFLNIFYALEWVLFAGAALYIWYRLMRDIHERELDEAETSDASRGGADPREDAPGGAATGSAVDERAEGVQRATVD